MTRIRDFSRQFLDGTFMLGALSKAWPAAAGILTIGLIASKFSAIEQGYYMTFLALLQTAVFFEMGLGQVVIQFASHERSRFELGDLGLPHGDPQAISRLASITQLVHVWFSIASVLMLLIAGIGGFWFFSQNPAPGIQWQWPWFLLVFGASLDLMFLPAESILQGCDGFRDVYKYRLIRSIARQLVLWLAMLAGLSLWAPGIALIISLAIGLPNLLLPKRKLFATLLRMSVVDRIGWKTELLPVQWRIAASWISGYFIQSMFTPISFYFLGPIAGGKVGVCVAIATMLSAVASTWAESRQARFGILVAKKSWESLDKEAVRVATLGVLTSLLGVVTMMIVIFQLYRFAPDVAARFLGPLGLFCFLATAPINVLINSQAIYLRAHKKEPFMPLSIASGLLTAGGALLAAVWWNADGMAIAWLVSLSLATLPWSIFITMRCRKAWHDPVNHNGG
jgi:hypothetical protein